MEELKEFIEEAEEEENLLTTAPISEVDIHEMSKEELKDFVMEAVIETKLLEPIVIPIREAQLVQMSKYVKAKQFVEGRCTDCPKMFREESWFVFQRLLCREGLKELIMETPELIEKVINVLVDCLRV